MVQAARAGTALPRVPLPRPTGRSAGLSFAAHVAPPGAEHDASIILARWRDAEEGAKGDAHAGYLAALDREAHAAAVLRRRLEMR
jgi:hypothetical protein